MINSVNYMTKKLRSNLGYRDIVFFFDHQPVFPQAEFMGLEYTKLPCSHFKSSSALTSNEEKGNF